MRRFLRQSLNVALLSGGIAITTMIALLIVIITLFSNTKVMETVECRLGLSDTCLMNDLRQKERELEQKRREALELERRSAELEALYERLAQLEHSGSSYVIFHSQTVAGYEVTTGHAYASLIEPDRLTSGWCYTSGTDHAGVTTRLNLASFETDMRLEIAAPSNDALASFGVSHPEFSRLVLGCQWPEGVA